MPLLISFTWKCKIIVNCKSSKLLVHRIILKHEDVTRRNWSYSPRKKTDWQRTSFSHRQKSMKMKEHKWYEGHSTATGNQTTNECKKRRTKCLFCVVSCWQFDFFSLFYLSVKNLRRKSKERKHNSFSFTSHVYRQVVDHEKVVPDTEASQVVLFFHVLLYFIKKVEVFLGVRTERYPRNVTT